MLPHDLLEPEAWPARAPRRVELIETHVSWVLRGDREVLKVKKPVDYGFLDFRDSERRRAACEAEVRLNSRLAPDVYLGVVPIMESDDGRLTTRGGGRVVDWAVRMRRLDDGRRADKMLEAGVFGADDVDRLARVVAEFHRAGH